MKFERTASGLEIVKRSDSVAHGKEVSLTRKTNIDGEIRHGVVLTSKRYGTHRRVATFSTIAPAYKLYKALAK